MPAEAILTCWGNSHPFQERRISLEEPIKVGRSVAQSRPSSNNAIFDCKVLSRNHALIWFENGKFFLQDTKSSNGTFVNNQRLSKGSEESAPREIFSSDILQFGVDVVENSRKVTHSCILAMVKFFDSEGKEIIKNNTGNESSHLANNAIQSQEFYQLLQFLQEALHREQLLENKLAILKQLVQSTQETSDSGWQSLINEERLLSKLEILENQLCVCSKLQPDENLKQEILALQDDKFQYECIAKDSLRTVLEEKLEAIKKISLLEQLFNNKEEECLNLQELCHSAQTELESLAGKYQAQLQELQEMKVKLQETEKKKDEESEEFSEEKNELIKKIEDLTENLKMLHDKVESLQADKDFSTEQLNNIRAKMELLNKFQDNLDFSEGIDQAVQVDLVNLLDLHLLESASEEGKQESSSLICENENSKHKLVEDADLICELNKANEVATKYKVELQKQASQLAEDQEAIRKLQGNLSQSESELASQRSNIQSLRGMISGLECQLQQYRNKENTWTENLSNEVLIKKEIEKNVKESDDVGNAPKKSEFELNKLKVEFLILKDECLQLRQRIIDVENEVQRSHDENATLKHEHSKLHQSYDILEQTTKKFDDFNATDSQKEIIQSKSELFQKQSEIDTLKETCAGYGEQAATLHQQLDLALEDYSILSHNTQTISILSIIPLAVLVASFVVAFYPFFSSLTATSSTFST